MGTSACLAGVDHLLCKMFLSHQAALPGPGLQGAGRGGFWGLHLLVFLGGPFFCAKSRTHTGKNTQALCTIRSSRPEATHWPSRVTNSFKKVVELVATTLFINLIN